MPTDPPKSGSEHPVALASVPVTQPAPPHSVHPAALPPPGAHYPLYHQPIPTGPAPAIEYPHQPSWLSRHKWLVGMLVPLVTAAFTGAPKLATAVDEGAKSYVKGIVDAHNEGHTHKFVEGQKVTSQSHPSYGKSIEEHDRAVRELQQDLHEAIQSLDAFFEQQAVDWALEHGPRRTSIARSQRASRIYLKLRKQSGYAPHKAYEIAKHARIEDD